MSNPNSILQAIGMLENWDLKHKSAEYNRQMGLKCPVGQLKKGDVCRPCIAVELAIRELGINYDPKNLIPFRMANEKDYKAAFIKIEAMLGLSNSKNLIGELAIKFGGHRSAGVASELLEKYKILHSQSLPIQQRQHANYSRPAYHLAAYYCAMLTEKIPADKNKICRSMVNVEQTEFKEVLESMQSVLGLHPKAKQQKEPLKRKEISNPTTASGTAKKVTVNVNSQQKSNRIQLMYVSKAPSKTGNGEPPLSCKDALEQWKERIKESSFSKEYIKWKDSVLRSCQQERDSMNRQSDGNIITPS